MMLFRIEEFLLDRDFCSSQTCILSLEMQAVFLAEAHAVTPEFTSEDVDPVRQGTGAALWSSGPKVGWRLALIAPLRLFMADTAG